MTRSVPILLLAVCFASAPARAQVTDSDGDGVPDATDNCTFVVNPAQIDTDADGSGNRCDADFNNDCIVNSADVNLFIAAFQSGLHPPLYDLDNNQFVNSVDFNITQAMLGSPPGPPGCSVQAGSVSGFARNLNNVGLANITVEVAGLTTLTSASGAYQISGVPYGSYIVHASGNGYTFGSTAYQNTNYGVVISAATPTPTKTVIGYNRDPIVYVHGWNADTNSFIPYPSRLRTHGYADFLPELETSLLYTPPFFVNREHVVDSIDEAKDQTGRSKVILMGHSMGGLVSRTYLETRQYRDDVSEFFTFGTPHRGIPTILDVGCLPNQPGVCEMTKAGMILFNATHWKRDGVDYHDIGGNAPMWTTKQVCLIKLFGFKLCTNILWPDLTYRNAGGFAMGLAITGPDDAFIKTCSSIGPLLSTQIDRVVTHEVHAEGFGPREYFRWDGGPISKESYEQCVEDRLVSGSLTTCGTRSPILWCALPFFGLRLAGTPSDPFSEPATSDDTAQRALPEDGTIGAGDTVSRSVVVEGGGVVFSFRQDSGSATLHLVDPNGTTIDPAYVAATMVGSPTDPDAQITTQVDPGLVAYANEGGRAEYYFPNALPGTWQMIAVGNGDISPGGATFASDVVFESPFAVTFTADTLFAAPNTSTTFTLSLPADADVTVTMSVVEPSGNVVPLVPAHSTPDGYTAAWSVPEGPGYARVLWSVTGTRGDGVAFERGGFEYVQVRSTQLVSNGVQQVTAVPRPGDPTLYQSLDFDLAIQSGYSGDAQVSADLVDAGGNVVARASQQEGLTAGVNTVVLSFDGDDIFASGLEGPYVLTHVTLVDARDASILAGYAEDAYTTGLYHPGQFAREHDVPGVTTTGPYAGRSGESLSLSAVAADPESGSLTYDWDLDDDGSFEADGQSVSFAAPPVSATTRFRVVARVADASAHSATAETFVDVSPTVPGSPTDGLNHEITVTKLPNGQSSVKTMALGPADAGAIACGYQVILEPGTTGGLAGGPSSWSDVAVFYDSAAGCSATCPTGRADRIRLLSDAAGDPDATVSEATIASGCPGLTSAEVQAGLPGAPTPDGVVEGSLDGYEHTAVDAPARDARTTITVTNAGGFVPEPDFGSGLLAGIGALVACARARERRRLRRMAL
jgi:pimeloyl-ACP methyl ester carboxylesterase